MIAPRYQDTPAEKIPLVNTDDGKVSVKIIAGECLGTQATIETRIPITYLDIHLRPGATFVMPIQPTRNTFVYVWRGSGLLGVDLMPVQMGQVGLLSASGADFQMKTDEFQDCHILLISGEPIGEPVVKHGPFVMNTQAEIEQAIEDYRAGKLGSIPGKDERMRVTEAAQLQQQMNQAR